MNAGSARQIARHPHLSRRDLLVAIPGPNSDSSLPFGAPSSGLGSGSGSKGSAGGKEVDVPVLRA